MIFGQKCFQVLIVPLLLLKLDDFIVKLSLTLLLILKFFESS